MFTTLTIVAAWFSFGYCVTDIVLTRKIVTKLNKISKVFQVADK
jgi:hypothetical protein